ncbi:MAG: antibiotic biosynthesis monooxygenase [Maritimibacter sp.]|nr:antibiotic biosynthesis monooxygenase [Maritimibacter sp.]
MIIAHVDFDVAADRRTHALAVLRQQVEEVRALPGCRSFAPYADPVVPTRVSVVHEWESAEAFAGYSASAAFARSSAELRPLMTAPPSSRRYDATLIEEVA